MSHALSSIDFVPIVALGAIGSSASATLGITISWAAPFTLGILLSTYGVQRLLRRDDSKGWLNTDGVMVEAGVTSELVKERGDAWSKRYYPTGKFRYTLYGVEYESDTLTLEKSAIWSPDPSAIDAMLARLQPGALIPIYVNPQNYTQAVIYATSSSSNSPLDHFLVIGGLVVAAIGAAAALFW